MKKINSIIFFGLLVSFFCFSEVRHAAADDFWTTRGQPVIEKEHDVMISVKNGLATLKVKRVFKNKGIQADQVEMMIELPYNSVATGLRIKGKKQWYEAELMEAEMASIVYERLTGMGPFKARDPALLMWNDLGVLDLLVFPVNPGSENIIEYTLIQPAAYRDGDYYILYNSAVGQPDLAVPHISVSSTGKSSKIFINGNSVAAGKKTAVGQQMLDTDDAEIYDTDGDTMCDEDDDSFYDYNDEYLTCRYPGETLISVTAPKIDTLEVRFGVFDLGTGSSVVRLEIDAAKVLRPAPKKASVVFVIDASRSWGKDGIEAALSFCSAFVGHLKDAKYEIVLFRRKGARLFGRFLSASEWKQELKKFQKEGTLLEPGNGSHLEKGLEIAASALQGRKGPQRIIVLTDGRMRSSYKNASSFDAVSGLPENGVVHFVNLDPGISGSEPCVERTDDAELAPVPLSRGGIHIEVYGGYSKKDFKDAAEYLVRPIQIDDFEILWTSDDFSGYAEIPCTVDEGMALRYMFLADMAQPTVILKGRIWAAPFMRVVTADTEYSDTIVPALVFSNELYMDLERDEMLRAATAGKAVSPVTSYLSIEPGTRPSTIGLAEGYGEGGLAVMGIAAGAAGMDMGYGKEAELPDYGSVLRDLLVESAAACFFGAPPDTSSDIFVESTTREVVDVAVSSGDADLDSCIEEAAWTIDLPDIFTMHRYEKTITIP